MRSAYVERKTKETDIKLKLNLDGGDIKIDTGIGFFDHMLTAFSVHGGFGLKLTCRGDLNVDWSPHDRGCRNSSRQGIFRSTRRQGRNYALRKLFYTDGRGLGILRRRYQRQTVSCV